MKKVLSVLLIVCVLLSAVLIAPISASAFDSGEYEYDLNGDGFAVVTGYPDEQTDSKDYCYTVNEYGNAAITDYLGNGGDIIIPSKINDYAVTDIASDA